MQQRVESEQEAISLLVFLIENDVKQGDILSPLQLNFAVDYAIMKALEKDYKRIEPIRY